MRKLLKWFSELWKKIEKYLSKSRAFFSIIFLIIGVSYTIASYEFYFKERSLWKEYKEAVREFDEYMERKERGEITMVSGGVVSAVPLVDKKTDSKKSNDDKEVVDKNTTSTIGLSEVVDRVKMLESSGGVNDGCKRYGKVNGYGYRQNSREWVCFEEEKEVRKYVADLFEKRLKVMSLEESLCMYNIGVKTSECEYVNNFYKLS